MRMKALLPILASIGLFVALPATAASADSPALPTCNQLLQGPPKEVSAHKAIDSAKANADGSVTTVVTVTWSFAVSGKPGEKIFDCVWDGTPGQGSATVVGSTGHPGADCSQQGLPCTFTVTTQPLSPGPHTLCDIAMILGTWPMPQTIAGPAPSGSRTPACVNVDAPPPDSPTPTPSHSPTPSDSPDGLVGAVTTPGLPGTGSGLGLIATLVVGVLVVLGTVGYGFRYVRRRA